MCLEACQSGGREVPLKWSLSLVMRYLGRKWFWVGSIHVARADRREAHVKWTRTMQRLLGEGRIKGHPLKVMPEGRGNVAKGVELLKKGDLSWQKILVPVG